MDARHPQDDVHHASLRDPEAFWTAQAARLHWDTPPSRALDLVTKDLPAIGVQHPHWSWFPDGEMNITYNCIDRHVLAGNGNFTAIAWDSPVSGSKQSITYQQLLDEVEILAGVLREEGVRKGDVALIYSYRKLVQEAVQKSSFKPPKTIIWQRDQLRWDPVAKENGERNWQRIVKSGRNRGVKAGPVPVKSTDGLYIIYTSGTTGLPKGVLRDVGGHAVGLNFSMRYMFGLKRPGDVMFCASDIGWVVGHSYIVYGPLLAGATTVVFEGKPIGTPDAGTFWRIVEEYKVKTMFTAPTALRAIRREDGDNIFFEKTGARGGLKSLTALFLAGERSEPSIVTMYQRLLDKHCAPNAIVNDNWWSSESGSPISGLALNAAAGRDFNAVESPKPPPIKAGSAGKPMPGFNVKVVDDDGNEVNQGTMGNIVLGIPLAPTGMTTLWQDEERFYKGYMKRFDGRWIDTGDAGLLDNDGYVHVMSRSDDIINVAAHRFSTGAIEQAITSHPGVAEACVVGIPDALKGHLPFAFVTLATHEHPGPALPDQQLFQEVQGSVREQIGSIASLGGMIQGKGMIPKTRSGKTLRRVLRELVENAVHGEADREVQVPATVEDATVVEVARGLVKEYFAAKGRGAHQAVEARARPKL
ncbi:putative propionate- ligase [Diplodia seriata]|uniref:Putative propionate-ligase n=1 Tax=Diplodia seriata TaxID=420778 RepID=A0A0G2EWU2_9PEZI|nr:putative propionate- ligase [Diplodia seriata]